MSAPAGTAWIPEWLAAHPAPVRGAEGIDVSYSQVRAFLECPWQYRLKYVEGRRAPLTPASALGLSIHGALEDFHRRGADGPEALLECYDERWIHAGFSDPQEQMEWYRKGERILQGYWEEESARRSEVLGVEREFLFPLGPHSVRGMIDRIDRRPDGTVEIVDYKTHLDVKAEEEVAGDLQLVLYGAGAEESLGLEPRWLTVDYVAARKRVSVPYDPEAAERVKALVHRVADLCASGRAFAPDTSYCPGCGFRKSCGHSVARD